MLDPLYYSRVEVQTNPETGLTEYVIADRPISNDLTYEITQYAKVGIYVLVGWILKGIPEAMTGETLWRDRTPIASDGGTMQLFASSSSEAQGMSQFPVSVWDTISSDVGVYGVPVQIAKSLRDPKNIVILR